MIELHTFDDPGSQAEALAVAVAAALSDAHAGAVASGDAGSRILAVSGGTSPRRFFDNLSRAALASPLTWRAIDVTLVDDRWVAEDDSASNAALVRSGLLHNAAATSRFLPLVDISREPEQHVSRLNHNADYRQPDVAVLGMGEDGHTASLFADAPEWEAVLSTSNRYVVVHPTLAPHARISLSMDALINTRRLFLLISGARKLAVLNQALAGPNNNAISKLANHKGVHIDVYWCAD